jgi:hypothetical protein
MEKATLTPFSYRGRGSAFESRLLSEVGAAGGVLFDGFATVEAGLEALDGCAFDFAVFFDGGELERHRISQIW